MILIFFAPMQEVKTGVKELLPRQISPPSVPEWGRGSPKSVNVTKCRNVNGPKTRIPCGIFTKSVTVCGQLLSGLTI